MLRLLGKTDRLRDRGRLAEARRLLGQFIDPVSGGAPKMRLPKAEVWRRIGNIDLALADLASARFYLTEALTLYRAFDATDSAPVLALQESLGSLLIRFGDWDAAFELFAAIEALKRRLWGPHHPERATALVQLALVSQKRGTLDRAQALLDEALAIQARALSPNSIEIAATLRSLGLLAIDAENPVTARDRFEAALAIERRALGNDHPDVGLTLLALGQAWEALGDDIGCRTCVDEALRIALREDGIALRDTAYHALSRIQARQGRLAAAIYFGKQAVNTIQRQRGSLAALEQKLQDSFVTSKEGIYRHLADLLVRTGRLGEAQRTLDLLKEQELSSFIIVRDIPIQRHLSFLQLTRLEASWTRHGDDIAGDLARLAEEEQRLVGRSNGRRRDEGRLTEVRASRDAARARFTAWLDELVDDLRHERDGARADEGALNVEILNTLQGDLAELGPDVALLHYIVGRDRLAIIVTTPEQVSRDVTIAEVDLNNLIARFRRALRAVSRDTTELRELGQALHRHLILPVTDDVQARAVVMVVLDGALRYLPLAALHDGRDYLLARQAFVMVTPASGTSLKELARDWNEAGVGALGVSRSEGHEALDAVREELRAIVRQKGENEGVYPGRRYLNADFTLKALAEALAARSVIHIASHFTFEAATAASSRLLLGDGAALSLEDLRRLDFQHIDLVALAACETALGSEGGGAGANGSEFESLGAVIQDRGARAVLATLWAVEDRSTAALMKQFYLNRQGGLSKAEALRQAQMALFRDGGDHAHPFFWAPFILMGNWL